MISVYEAEKLSLKGIAAFLHASEEIYFLGENRQQVEADDAGEPWARKPLLDSCQLLVELGHTSSSSA